MSSQQTPPPVTPPPCPKCNDDVDTAMSLDDEGQVIIIASCRGCHSVGTAVAEGVSADILDIVNPPVEAVQAWFLAQRLAIENIAA